MYRMACGPGVWREVHQGKKAGAGAGVWCWVLACWQVARHAALYAQGLLVLGTGVVQALSGPGTK